MGIYIMTAALIFAALWAVLCRINQMKHRVTQVRVFLQHAALALGLFSALLLSSEYALLAVVGGVFVFLILGSHRWKAGPPEGITRHRNLDPLEFPRISGGKGES